MNENQTNNENKTVNIPTSLSNDVELDKPHVQVPAPSSDEEGYYTIGSQEMEPDPNLSDCDLPAISNVNYYGDVNVLASTVSLMKDCYCHCRRN